jgi:hypothetical protein
VNKIRNTKSSWLKQVNKWVKLWVEDSAWDGSPEWIDTYVYKVTNKGVWFTDGPENRFPHWVNFKKIKGYSK